jgi:hypothetical protein
MSLGAASSSSKHAEAVFVEANDDGTNGPESTAAQHAAISHAVASVLRGELQRVEDDEGLAADLMTELLAVLEAA